MSNMSLTQNRVKKVKKRSNAEQWDYVHTTINPADIGTRESSAMKIDTDQRWWYAPSLPHKKVKKADVDMKSNPDVIKERPVLTLAIHFDPENSVRNLIDMNKYSSLQKLLNVTAYMLRFADRKVKTEGGIDEDEVSAEEKERALKIWIRAEQGEISKRKTFGNLQTQLSLFSDEDGILRLKGRLGNSHLPYDAKHPLLLDKDSYFTTLIIREAHYKVKHMRVKSTLNEVRSRFWVCSGKRTVGAAIAKCVWCRCVIGKTMKGPAPPDLPEHRVSYEFAWQSIGIDYAGPVYVKDIYSTSPDMHKAYICLMTCAATRNVHIELVPNMSAPALIRCLKRFTGRRGKFHLGVSDNFKSFIGTELKQFLSNEGISWKTILPKSPWWGAFYERLIRIIKESLKKCLGNAKLTYEELETVLIEIESVVNSRPLTYLYDEVDEALTPSHLAIGRRLVSDVLRNDPPVEVKQTTESVNARYRYLQTIIDHYWKRFSKEYLLELHQHLNSRKGSYDELGEHLLGDVVLIKDDATKRKVWKKGRVEQLVRGNDGKVRGAVLKVKSPTGNLSTIRRPVQKLIPLEVQRSSSDINPSPITVLSQSTTTPVPVEQLPVPETVEPDPSLENNDDLRSRDISSRGRIRYKVDRFQAS